MYGIYGVKIQLHYAIFDFHISLFWVLMAPGTCPELSVSKKYYKKPARELSEMEGRGWDEKSLIFFNPQAQIAFPIFCC